MGLCIFDRYDFLTINTFCTIAIVKGYSNETTQLFLTTTFTSISRSLTVVPRHSKSLYLPRFAPNIQVQNSSPSSCRGTQKVSKSCLFFLLKCRDLPCFGTICEVCGFRRDCEKCNEISKSRQNGAS